MTSTRKVHLAYLGLLLLAAAGIVTFDGMRRASTGSGVIAVVDWGKATSPASRPEGRLRLGIFNIASGVGQDGVLNLGRTAETISQVGADVVALQEVRRNSYGFQNGATELGVRLKLRAAWAPSECRWWRDDFGNGFLSRLPVEGEQLLRVPLPQTQERGHRNVTVTRVRFGDAWVTVLGTHVDRERDQKAQLCFLEEMFLGLPEPAVLMGDMNVTASNEVVQDLVRHHGVTEVGPANPRRIELILVRGLRGVDAGQLDLKASDHPMVWADVELK